MTTDRRAFLRTGLVGGLSALLPGCTTAPRRKPNLVVVLIDTLRPDFLDAYGYPRTTAPFLGEIAKRSVVFERAFSTSSWTVPSVASLFTSEYPNQHGVVQGLMAFQRQLRARSEEERATLTLNRLSNETETLAERFQNLGYATYGIAANINLGPELGFQRGFDVFEFDVELTAYYFHWHLERWKEQLDASEPYLCYLHLNDVHSPFERRPRFYQAPASKEPRELKRADYISEIGYVDEFLQKIYELLAPDGNTVFLFLSDHGEEFWDHEGTFHGFTLYREVNQVLMMFTGPGMVPQRVRANTSLIDVLPTIVDLAGGDMDPRWQGISLKPLLENAHGASAVRDHLDNRTLFAHLDKRGRHRWAALDRDGYLIETRSGECELYDFPDDWAQTTNLCRDDPERSAALSARIAELKAQSATHGDAVEIPLDDAMIEQLETLGYVEK